MIETRFKFKVMRADTRTLLHEYTGCPNKRDDFYVVFDLWGIVKKTKFVLFQFLVLEIPKCGKPSLPPQHLWRLLFPRLL